MDNKLYKRKIVDDLVKFLNKRDIIVVHGARQVGKTSLMKYLQKNYFPNNSFYFDLEFQDLLELCNSGAQKVYDHLLTKGADEKSKIYLIIDEIQYLDDPSSFMKIIHDHFSQIKLIVTGSSSFNIKKKFKDSLVGRTINFELYSLDFEEYLLFKEKEYRFKSKSPKSINQELMPYTEDFIRYGGYPKIVLEPQSEIKLKYISQIIDTYIRKDIRDIGKIRDISSFNKLIQILASQSGSILNILELSNTIGISRTTVMEYLDLLENTYIIKRIGPYHKNIRSELTKNPKVYILDTGLMHVLWLKQFPKITLGNVFETFVFLELLKNNHKINYWRTTNKQEVDFIVSNHKLLAAEAKYSFKKSKNLDTFCKNYNCTGYIVGLRGKPIGKYPWELLEVLKGEN